MKKTFLGGVHANAVGAGIGIAIHATQEPPTPVSAEAWVRCCIKAAAEAHAAALSDPPIKIPAGEETQKNILLRIGDIMHQQDVERGIQKPRAPNARPIAEAVPYEGEELKAIAFDSAREAFRLCMPPLTSRRNAKGYIACVAVGTQRRYFTAVDAKAMLYAAQMTLAVHPPRHRTPREQRQKAGFQA